LFEFRPPVCISDVVYIGLMVDLDTTSRLSIYDNTQGIGALGCRKQLPIFLGV
jgi:hypothetical protein